MKDGKYEVGDVIAFRVKRMSDERFTATFENPALISSGKITESMQSCGTWGDYGNDTAILERIPNPKLMDGEWWKGWTVERRAPKVGEVYIDCPDRDVKNGDPVCTSTWDINPAIKPIVLVPPKSSLCPELKAQIDRLETELAALKKQALGE